MAKINRAVNWSEERSVVKDLAALKVCVDGLAQDARRGHPSLADSLAQFASDFTRFAEALTGRKFDPELIYLTQQAKWGKN